MEANLKTNMNHNHDLALLLVGSFLPNNLFIWVFIKIKRVFKREEQCHNIKLISPRRYYAKFETDPKTQYDYHRRMQKFWLFNFLPMNVIVGVDIWATLNNRAEISLLTTALLLAINTNYSLYANFDTETGDAHTAYASIKIDQVQDGYNQDVNPEPVKLEPFRIPTPL